MFLTSTALSLVRKYFLDVHHFAFMCLYFFWWRTTWQLCNEPFYQSTHRTSAQKQDGVFLFVLPLFPRVKGEAITEANKPEHLIFYYSVCLTMTPEAHWICTLNVQLTTNDRRKTA